MDQQQQPAGAQASAGNQIRSRITVVCGECKRLKLKCDRRAPCGSCIKRDTTARCIYSAAAAEKIDVQSLHNRVSILETQLQVLNGGQARLANRAGLDRAPVIISGGSSIIVQFEDITAVWLDHLDLFKDYQFHPVNEQVAASNFFDGSAFPDLSLFRLEGSDIPCVTPFLVERLPPDAMREILLAEFQNFMLLRPSFNFPGFRNRVRDLFANNTSLPTLSFFACVAFGFALGAQSWLESNRSGSLETPRTYDPDALYTLADHALQVYEKVDSVHDVDYINAMILQVLFLIHDGKPRVHSRVYDIVGKMVIAARAMGLAVDPDDTPGKYSTFEAEMRRRAWWDVFYYDLFISDFFGQVPTIADNTFTTNMPAECDDDLFNAQSSSLPPPNETSTQSNNTFFLLKCRSAQLVKNMKKRVFQDPKLPAVEPSLELAQACEAEIVAWVADLPAEFRVPVEIDPSQPPLPPYLLAQRCELSMVANSLILKMFLPFIKKSSPRTPGNALYASVNAAHKIVLAADQLQQHMKGPRHSLAFMSYFFNSQLFHAAVVCANACILDPSGVPAKECLKDLQNATRIMHDPFVPTSRGPLVGGIEGSKSEPLRVLDILQKKAEEARRGSAYGGLGTKRKHTEVDDQIPPGFHVPYVGPSVVTKVLRRSPPAPPPADSASQASGSKSRAMQPAGVWVDPSQPTASTSTLRVGSTRERAKTHSHYPSAGIRVRNKGDANSRRDSVGNSARRSIPPGTSGVPQPHTVPATPQGHSPHGPLPGGAPFGAPHSGPSSTSASGSRPMELGADYTLSFNDARPMTGVSETYAPSFSGPPAPHPPTTYAPGPSYTQPGPGFFMGPPSAPVQFHGAPPPMQAMQTPMHAQQTFDASQMGYGNLPPMDSSPVPHQPTRTVSAPMTTNYISQMASDAGDAPAHNAPNTSPYRVQQPQWPAEDPAQFTPWNYDAYQQ